MPGEDDKKLDDKKVDDKKIDDKKPEDVKKDEAKKEDTKDAKPADDKKGDSKVDDSMKKEDVKGDTSDDKKAEYTNFGPNDEEDPYANDEETYKEHFRKTFITQDKNKKEQVNLYTLHDMMIPAGRTAKLVRVADPTAEDFRVTEPMDKLKFVEPTPVIILAGAMTDRAGKVLAGVARAAFRAGACIIDSGVGSGIEKFCLRKNVPLIGVCPEAEISYPVNSSNKKENELTNGHTHFFLIGSEDSKKSFKWGEEAKLKAEVAKRVAKGRTKYGNSYTWKIITVVVGDNPNCVEDIVQAKENDFPIIVLEGSQFCSDIISAKGGLFKEEEEPEEKKGDAEGDAEDNIGGDKKTQQAAPEGREINNSQLKDIVSEQKIYMCKQNSEHIANITHLLLTVTL